MGEFLMHGRYQSVRTAMDRAIIDIASGTISGVSVIANVCGRMNMQTNFVRMREGTSTHQERKQRND